MSRQPIFNSPELLNANKVFVRFPTGDFYTARASARRLNQTGRWRFKSVGLLFASIVTALVAAKRTQKRYPDCLDAAAPWRE